MTLKTLIAAGCFSVAAAISASAATVTVDGTEWEVSTIEGSFDDNQTLLESQIWFGDQALATEFSIETGDEFGRFGPFFAYGIGFSATRETFVLSMRTFTLSDTLSNTFPTGVPTATNLSFAVATPVAAVPLPAGGLLLLSAFGGVAALKRRKKRAA